MHKSLVHEPPVILTVPRIASHPISARSVVKYPFILCTLPTASHIKSLSVPFLFIEDAIGRFRLQIYSGAPSAWEACPASSTSPWMIAEFHYQDKFKPSEIFNRSAAGSKRHGSPTRRREASGPPKLLNFFASLRVFKPMHDEILWIMRALGVHISNLRH